MADPDPKPDPTPTPTETTTTLQIKHSSVTQTPNSLLFGEFAVSSLGSGTSEVTRLYIGNSTSNPILIGSSNSYDSPAFTGTPTAPTTHSDDSSTRIATTAFSQSLLIDKKVLNFQGPQDCSTSPNYPDANAGDVYSISKSGKIGGANGLDVQAGDLLICVVTGTSGDQATVGPNWKILENFDRTQSLYTSTSSTSGDIVTYGDTTGKNLTDSGFSIDSTGPLSNSNTTIPTSLQISNAIANAPMTTYNGSTSIAIDNNHNITVKNYTGTSGNICPLIFDSTGLGIPIDNSSIKINASGQLYIPSLSGGNF